MWRFDLLIELLRDRGTNISFSVVTCGHVPYYLAATALTRLLRRGVGIQLNLVWEVVVLIVLHLLCQGLARCLLECLFDINCLLRTRLEWCNSSFQTAPLMQLLCCHLASDNKKSERPREWHKYKSAALFVSLVPNIHTICANKSDIFNGDIPHQTEGNILHNCTGHEWWPLAMVASTISPVYPALSVVLALKSWFVINESLNIRIQSDHFIIHWNYQRLNKD